MADTILGGSQDISWKQVFRVWWLLAWRGLAGLIIIGGAVGSGVGYLLNAIGAPPDLIKVMSTLLGFAVYLLWGLVIVRMAIRKKYSDFDLKFTTR